MNTLFHWIVSAAALYFAALFVPGVTINITGALVGAVVLALINFFIRPILYILTLPINIITLGLFSLVINGVLIYYAAALTPFGVFAVSSFIAAFWLALILALVNIVFGLRD